MSAPEHHVARLCHDVRGPGAKQRNSPANWREWVTSITKHRPDSWQPSLLAHKRIDILRDTVTINDGRHQHHLGDVGGPNTAGHTIGPSADTARWATWLGREYVASVHAGSALDVPSAAALGAMCAGYGSAASRVRCQMWTAGPHGMGPILRIQRYMPSTAARSQYPREHHEASMHGEGDIYVREEEVASIGGNISLDVQRGPALHRMTTLTGLDTREVVTACAATSSRAGKTRTPWLSLGLEAVPAVPAVGHGKRLPDGCWTLFSHNLPVPVDLSSKPTSNAQCAGVCVVNGRLAIPLRARQVFYMCHDYGGRMDGVAKSQALAVYDFGMMTLGTSTQDDGRIYCHVRAGGQSGTEQVGRHQWMLAEETHTVGDICSAIHKHQYVTVVNSAQYCRCLAALLAYIGRALAVRGNHADVDAWSVSGDRVPTLIDTVSAICMHLRAAMHTATSATAHNTIDTAHLAERCRMSAIAATHGSPLQAALRTAAVVVGRMVLGFHEDETWYVAAGRTSSPRPTFRSLWPRQTGMRIDVKPWLPASEVRTGHFVGQRGSGCVTIQALDPGNLRMAAKRALKAASIILAGLTGADAYCHYGGLTGYTRIAVPPSKTAVVIRQPANMTAYRGPVHGELNDQIRAVKVATLLGRMRRKARAAYERSANQRREARSWTTVDQHGGRHDNVCHSGIGRMWLTRVRMTPASYGPHHHDSKHATKELGGGRPRLFQQHQYSHVTHVGSE